MNIIYYKKVKSTQRIARSKPIGTIIVALEQTHGRGQYKRRWSSKPGGLYASIVIDKIRKQGLLAIIAGLSARTAIEGITKTKVTIKWPNDILIYGKKVAGILGECTENSVIIGIGINVNNPVPNGATSISSIKKTVTCSTVLKSFITQFFRFLKMPFKELNSEFLKHHHKQICVKMKDKHFCGKVFGIGNNGELKVKTNDSIKIVFEGTIAMLK